MKKINYAVAIIFAAAFVAQSASAKDGPYVGLDAIGFEAKGKLHPRDKLTDEYMPITRATSNQGFGAGFSIGYKKSFDSLFVAPEVFYDYAHLKLNDYYKSKTSDSLGSGLSFRGRYGAKVNLGVNINEKFSTYLTYGLANVDYVSSAPLYNMSEAGSKKMTPIYGFGFLFNLNDTSAIKAEYNRQDFNIKYGLGYTTNNVDQVAVSKMTLQALKIGYVYSF